MVLDTYFTYKTKRLLIILK